LGNTLQELGRSDEAEASLRLAIALKPDYAEAHINLGATLQKLRRLDEAEASYTQAIALMPDLAEARNNLGGTLQELGRLDEAEASYRQAIALKPGLADAHNNLGATLYELGRLDEAEASYRQAIELKPNFAEAHSGLGNTLRELGRLEEAVASFRQAITLKPNFAEAHISLGIAHYARGDLDAAIESIELMIPFSPLTENNMLLAILKAKKARVITEAKISNTNNLNDKVELPLDPLIVNRVVEPELIDKLYKLETVSFDQFKKIQHVDARYGGGTCSANFKLFEDDSSIIKSVARDLTKIISEVLKSDIFIVDSFFNIQGSASGIVRHRHLNKMDRVTTLGLRRQKYSLVYYLSVGNQDCSDPGILKFYEPSDEVLPYEGMIVIFPAARYHSVVYNGEKDRVVIAVNFYCL